MNKWHVTLSRKAVTWRVVEVDADDEHAACSAALDGMGKTVNSGTHVLEDEPWMLYDNEPPEELEG